MRELWGGIRNWWRCLALLGALTLLVSGLRNPGALKSYFYGAFREGSRVVLDLQNQHLPVLEGKHFQIRYQDVDANAAGLVLETAEGIFALVNQSFGFVPSRKVPVVIYPNGDALARCFGWPADEAALGVYWIGTIRILSPNAWAAGPDGDLDAVMFKESGPMAHEYTHYVIDYLTGGNYPRWFTEGVAQWQEKQITGFTFSNPFLTLEEQNQENSPQKLPSTDVAAVETEIFSELYPLTEMDIRFDCLPNQMLAYWESRRAIEYINAEFGPDRIQQIIECLGQGYSMNRTLERSLGVNLRQFDQNFRQWAAQRAAKAVLENRANQLQAGNLI